MYLSEVGFKILAQVQTELQEKIKELKIKGRGRPLIFSGKKFK